PHCIDQHISNQILTGDDVQLLRCRLGVKQARQLRRLVQKRLRLRQELLPRGCQLCPPPEPAAFFIELGAQSLFQRQQSAAQPLLGNEKHFCCRSQTPLPGELHERGHLIGRKRRQQVDGHNARFLG